MDRHDVQAGRAVMGSLGEAEISAIWLSLKVALVSTVALLPVAIALAALLARGRFHGRTLLQAVVTLPLVLPPVVTGYILLIAFGRTGVIGSFLESQFGIVIAFRWTGAVLAAAVMSLPLMVQAIRLAMESVDRGLETAASTLGARPAMVFLTVTLPLSLPGILAGAILGFAKALGEFGATITFASAIPGQTLTIASAIHAALQDPDGEAIAWRLTLISIAISLGAVVASELLAARLRDRLGTGQGGAA